MHSGQLLSAVMASSLDMLRMLSVALNSYVH